jgi:hypothetical protein
MLALQIEGMVSCGVIYLQSFRKIGRGIQAVLKFCLRNLRGYNVGITDVENL